MKTDSGDQQPDISDTPRQIHFNDFQRKLKKSKKIQT